MNDWRLWLGTKETQVAIKTITEETNELAELITNGSHLQEKSIDKIALDYTYSLGQLDGMRKVIQMIKDISEIVDDSDDQTV